nr:MAG TPA: hypothetical protein [Caudoviricetes sp.]
MYLHHQHSFSFRRILIFPSLSAKIPAGGASYETA